MLYVHKTTIEDVDANLAQKDYGLKPQAPPLKPAWSLYLQGNSKTAERRLFLFPDGSGAATSYMRIPNIAPDTALIAFNSPVMK
jgi:hypothetical protein